MISETLSNVVYFSSLLPERCPKTFGGLKEVLERYSVEYRFLQGTKDIWCRDYMPIQTCGRHFTLFGYHPDYLLDSPEHRESIIPKFNIPEDDLAFHQIEKLMPDYKSRIEMVDATDLIRHEGCLNCASWTISDSFDETEYILSSSSGFDG